MNRGIRIPHGFLQEKVISQGYCPLSIDLRKVGGANMVKYADDKIFVVGSNGIRRILISLISTLAVCTLFMLIPLWVTDDYPWEFILPLVLLILSISLYSLFAKKRKYDFIFNRETGEVFFAVKQDEVMEYRKVPFSELEFYRSSSLLWYITQLHAYARENGNMFLLGSLEKTSLNNDKYYLERVLQTILWYMDRNRPLPPGTAFDPYRERDYERRRSERFPEPLYASQGDIPEWSGARGSKERMEYRDYVHVLKSKYPGVEECTFQNGELIPVREQK